MTRTGIYPSAKDLNFPTVQICNTRMLMQKRAEDNRKYYLLYFLPQSPKRVARQQRITH